MTTLQCGVPAHRHTLITVLDVRLVCRLQLFNHYTILKSMPTAGPFSNCSCQRKTLIFRGKPELGECESLESMLWWQQPPPLRLRGNGNKVNKKITYMDLTLRFAFMPSMCNVGYYSPVFLLHWHYMFRPNRPSSGVQIVLLKEFSAQC
jgi:hypothetical protein